MPRSSRSTWSSKNAVNLGWGNPAYSFTLAPWPTCIWAKQFFLQECHNEEPSKWPEIEYFQLLKLEIRLDFASKQGAVGWVTGPIFGPFPVDKHQIQQIFKNYHGKNRILQNWGIYESQCSHLEWNLQDISPEKWGEWDVTPASTSNKMAKVGISRQITGTTFLSIFFSFC